MKALYLIETLSVGGAEQSLLQILPRLRGVQPVMCHVYEGDELRPMYEAAGIPVVSLNVPPKYQFRTAIRLVEDLVRKERPALIHTTLFRAEIVGRFVGRRFGIPVVCSFVSECYADMRWRMLSPPGRLKLKGVQVLDRLTAPMATHFISNSSAVAEAQIRALGVPPDRVTVIHRGRDPSRFPTCLPPDQESHYRESLGIPASAPVVINVGRLVDSKGQMELIEAFEQVVRVIPDATLLIAGEGPERNNLEREVRARRLVERIRLLGTRDDIPQLLALSNVFAFPSHYEGHPGAVVEAMFAGKAIVVSDNAVHRETITHHETGLFVPTQDPDTLADAMLTLLQAPLRALELGERARQVALKRFDIAQAAAQHDALYNRIVTEYRRGHQEDAPERGVRARQKREGSLREVTYNR